MAGTFRTRVAWATVGVLLLASSTVWADGDARTWAAVKKWTGTVTVRVTYKTARTVDGTSITMSVSRLLNAKVTFEIDKDKTQVDESDIVTWHSTTCEVTGNVQDEARAVGSDGGVARETWRASGAGDDCELHLAIEAGPDRKAKYSFAPPSAGVNGTMVFEIPGAPAFTQAQKITLGASLGGALVSPDSPAAACCEGPLPTEVGPLGRTVTIPGADLPFLTPFGIEANVATARAGRRPRRRRHRADSPARADNPVRAHSPAKPTSRSRGHNPAPDREAARRVSLARRRVPRAEARRAVPAASRPPGAEWA